MSSQLFYTFYLQACTEVTIVTSKLFAADTNFQNALLTTYVAIDYPEVKLT